MSTELTWQTISTSTVSTEQLAARIGTRLRGGEVIELIADLGGGKTTFVRGLAKGMGSRDKVSSPTFTISNEYACNGLKMLHYDFYRLSEAGIMADELTEEINDPETVVVIEWGDVVADVLPADRLTIKIEATGEDDRELTFTYPEKYGYLLEGEA